MNDSPQLQKLAAAYIADPHGPTPWSVDAERIRGRIDRFGTVNIDDFPTLHRILAAAALAEPVAAAAADAVRAAAVSTEERRRALAQYAHAAAARVAALETTARNADAAAAAARQSAADIISDLADAMNAAPPEEIGEAIGRAADAVSLEPCSRCGAWTPYADLANAEPGNPDGLQICSGCES